MVMTGKMYINIMKINENDNPNSFIFFFVKNTISYFFSFDVGGKL